MTAASALTTIILELADGTRYRAEATMDSEIERVRFESAVKPDPRWKATDARGHEHAYVQDAGGGFQLPTLRSERREVPCNGMCGDRGCEGYTTTVYLCVECGAEVEPGVVPDYAARNVGIPVSETRYFEIVVATEGHAPFNMNAPLEGATLVQGERRHALPSLTISAVTSGFDETQWTLVGSEMRSVGTGASS